jgi:hypothetical protein
MALGPSHHGLSTLQQSVAEPLEKFCNHWDQSTVVTTVTTFGGGLGLLSGRDRVCLLVCLWRELKGVLRICGDSGDGDDAHDDDIRAHSRQEAHLYFVGHYTFNLTRRTRRAEQGVPYLCDL